MRDLPASMLKAAWRHHGLLVPPEDGDGTADEVSLPDEAEQRFVGS